MASDSTTSIHVTAIDSIVNVNSLFTVAVFIGFSFNVPSADMVGNTPSCNVGIETVRRLIVSEIVAFSSFLLSSLVAQSLKLIINSLNCLDLKEHLKADINTSELKFEHHKVDINTSALKLGLLVSALGSILGSVSLIISIVYTIQVKLGVLSCGGESVFAVAVLVVLVGIGLLIYVIVTLWHLFYSFIAKK